MSTEITERYPKRRNSRELWKRVQEKYTPHQFWIDSSMGKKIGENCRCS